MKTDELIFMVQKQIRFQRKLCVQFRIVDEGRSIETQYFCKMHNRQNLETDLKKKKVFHRTDIFTPTDIFPCSWHPKTLTVTSMSLSPGEAASLYLRRWMEGPNNSCSQWKKQQELRDGMFWFTRNRQMAKTGGRP